MACEGPVVRLRPSTKAGFLEKNTYLKMTAGSTTYKVVLASSASGAAGAVLVLIPYCPVILIFS